jgi:predicted aldo/keto reductase-like oxidoreductase
MRLPSDFDKSEKLGMSAYESGDNYYDTAYIYPGKEVLLGKILHKNGIREKVKIATKLPPFLCKSNADFDKIFDKQLSRLKTDYIDNYLLHMLVNPEQLQGLFDIGLKEWISGKKESGAVRKFGFSYHGNAADFVRLVDCFDWDFCMIQYNYLDENNQAGKSGLKHAFSKNIPVIIMEPLKGGMLANPKQIPKKAMKVFEANTAYNPAGWALKWLFNQEEVTCILSGMRNPDDLRQNIALAESTEPYCMTDSESDVIAEVTAAYNESNTIPCTGCNYCTPQCPVGVNIPGCFTAYNAKSFHQYMMNTGLMISKKGGASGCVGCRKCESHCPQGIGIAGELKKVSRKMEPFWIKAVTGVARKFTSR